MRPEASAARADFRVAAFHQIFECFIEPPLVFRADDPDERIRWNLLRRRRKRTTEGN